LQNRNRSPERTSSCVTCPCRRQSLELVGPVELLADPTDWLPNTEFGFVDPPEAPPEPPDWLVSKFRVPNTELGCAGELGFGGTVGLSPWLADPLVFEVPNTELGSVGELGLAGAAPAALLAVGLVGPGAQCRSRKLPRPARWTHPTHPRPRPMRHLLRLRPRLVRPRVPGRRQENMRRQRQAFCS